MSLQQPKSNRKSEQSSSLLLEEPYTPVQLGLRHLFGRNEAELIQNVNYWLNQPWEDWSLKLNMRVVIDDDRFWVRIPPRMLSDRFTGRARDLSESTLKRTFTSCIQQGVMLVRTDLSDEDEKNVRWATLVREVLDPQLSIYQEVWRGVIDERMTSRATSGRLLTDAREQELWDGMQLRLSHARETLRKAGLYDLQKIYELAGVQNDTPTYKASSASVRRVKMNPHGVQNDTHEGSKRTGSPVILNPKMAIPSIRKEKRERTTRKIACETPNVAVVVDSISSSPSAEIQPANPVTDLKTRLLDFAQTREIEISSKQADTIIATWPVASIATEVGLLDALTSKVKKWSLDEPLAENWARTNVQNDPARLRWLLCVWPGFTQSRDDYKGRGDKTKTACFVHAFKTCGQPPASWLENELASLRQREGAAKKAEEAARRNEFKAWRDKLSLGQIDALQTGVKGRLAALHPGKENYVWEDRFLDSLAMEIWADPQARAQTEAAHVEAPTPEPFVDERFRDVSVMLSDLAHNKSKVLGHPVSDEIAEEPDGDFVKRDEVMRSAKAIGEAVYNENEFENWRREKLSTSQVRVLQDSVKHHLAAIHPGRKDLIGDEAILRGLEMEMWADPQTRAQIEAVVVDESVSDAKIASYGPIPKATQLQLDIHVQPILRDINAGLLALAGVDERRPERLSDEEWRDAKRIIEERLAA